MSESAGGVCGMIAPVPYDQVILEDPRKARQQLLPAAFLGFGTSLVAVFLASDGSERIVRIVAIASVAVFGPMLADQLLALRRPPRAVVVLRDDGFEHNAFLGAGFVPWDEVAELRLTRIYRLDVVAGVVHHREFLQRRRRNPLKRLLGLLNGLSRSDIWIPDNNLEITARELLDLMVDRWQRFVAA
jgi:hypothetical protein